jgi:hypothetical protein
MADACHRHARRYRTLFIVPSSLCHLHYAMFIVPCSLCHVHYAIFITPSLYVVGSIAFGRRGAAVLAIVATLPPSKLLLTSWLGHRSLAC